MRRTIITAFFYKFRFRYSINSHILNVVYSLNTQVTTIHVQVSDKNQAVQPPISARCISTACDETYQWKAGDITGQTWYTKTNVNLFAEHGRKLLASHFALPASILDYLSKFMPNFFTRKPFECSPIPKNRFISEKRHGTAVESHIQSRTTGLTLLSAESQTYFEKQIARGNKTAWIHDTADSESRKISVDAKTNICKQ
jgi:hypothetical protein